MKKATTLIIAFTLCIHFGYSQCWKTVSVGVNHTLAIKTNGTLWAWGINQYGQLGDGGTANLFIPTQIGLDSNWSSIAAGENHSIALKSDGSLWAWGHNLSGQLGDSTYIDKLTPIRVGLSNNWQFISAGTNHNMAIQKDSTLWGWGQNGGGKIGTGSFASDYFQPYLIDNVKNWKTVSAGQEHSLAVRYNGTLWGCGSNIYGALGLGSAHTEFQAIQQIGASTDWSQVSASILFSLAIKNDSTLWGWGRNFEGQLGNGTTTSKLTPVQVDFQSKWLKIATGYQHSVAIKSDSSLWAWGNELGNGVGISTSPISKSSNHTWTTISAKGKFSMSIQQSNSLFAWGTSDNGIGQFGLGNGFLQSFSPMQVSCSVASCNPTTSTFSQSACGSYVFNGQTLTTSGVYKDTLQNAAGCDSVIALNLTIKIPTSSTLTQSTCSSYIFNNQTLTQSGAYYDTLQNSVGCDSIITLLLTIQQPQQLPFSEGFVANTFPPNWQRESASQSPIGGWFRHGIGVSPTPTGSMKIDNYNYDRQGKIDKAILPPLNFTNSHNITLSFNVAYRVYTNTNLYLDSLQIKVSTDCGNNYTSVYLKGGGSLASTVSSLTSSFTPSDSTQWRKDSIDLSPFSNFSEVLISFENIGHFGNNIYIDNININGNIVATPSANFSANNLQICSNDTIEFNDLSTGSPTAYLWQFPGGTPSSSTAQFPKITYTTPGIYDVKLKVLNASGEDSITKTNYISVWASSTTSIQHSICNGDSLFFNGQSIKNPGIYNDTLTNTHGCDSIVTLNLTINQATSSTLNQSACGSFVFNNQTLTQSGTYKDTLQNAAGCDSIVILNLTINTNPAPTVTASGYNITTQSFAGYQWQLNGNNIAGATAQNHTATANGSYSVAVSDANGCQGTSTAVNITGVGINATIADAQYNIYPNPVAHSLHIDVADNADVEATITTISGQRVAIHFFAKTIAITTEQWTQGVYTLQLKNSNGNTFNYRIVKE